MLEARNSKFHDFLVFQPVTGPQNQLYLSLERPGHLKQIKNKYGSILGKYYFCKYENQDFRTETNRNFLKGRSTLFFGNSCYV